MYVCMSVIMSSVYLYVCMYYVCLAVCLYVCMCVFLSGRPKFCMSI